MFREADMNLGVYGVAQPTIIGLKTVLSMLGCHPSSGEEKGDAAQQAVWVCTREEPVVYVGDRPFVLREANKPYDALGMSDRAENLEDIERRLKRDILAEAAKNQGLLLVHEEIPGSKLLKTMWVAVEKESVRTVREVFSWIRSEGWRVVYHRLPIAPDQPLEHNYLDAYTQVIKNNDPTKTIFVANCGAGVFRTTFAMIAAVLVRRRQYMLQTGVDPMADDQGPALMTAPAPSPVLGRTIRRVQDSMLLNHRMLRLMHVLNHNLSTRDTRAAIEQLLLRPTLLKSLQEANQGNFGLIRQLCGLLDSGLECKTVVDTAIDSCAHVINLRESILARRLSYATAAGEDELKSEQYLVRAAKALEEYYFLIAFSSYVEESKTASFDFRFADWLKKRAEIWRGIVRIRTLHHHLSLFDPVSDLSMISRGDAGGLVAPTDNALLRFGEVMAEGCVVPGDEFSDFVVRNRSGMVLRSGLLLKRDIWREFECHDESLQLRGVVNFRRVPHSNIFGTGQPTVDGMHSLLCKVLEEVPGDTKRSRHLLWINLREEPLVYVSGIPYCLRQREMSLRNITDYSGITSERLAQLESRLRGEVVSEIKNSDGKLLLHTETEDGAVVPLWEEARAEDISNVEDVMKEAAASLPDSVELNFKRVPVTAETSLEPLDVTEVLNAMLKYYDAHTPILINCQLGRGRTTLVSVFVLLIKRWLDGAVDVEEDPKVPRLSYHVINSLLRVLPHGQKTKRVVDDAIDECGQVLNIRQCIEDARLAALEASDNNRQALIKQGSQHLRRYFHLLVFQAYLDSVTPNTVLQHTFERYLHKQPVLSTIARELENPELATISPLGKVEITDGVALPDEVDEVVQNRSGSILSASTILKSDFFSGILKTGLPLRIDGVPNLRRVDPLLPLWEESTKDREGGLLTSSETWGCGMPTIDGLRSGLRCMGAHSEHGNPVVWTNLREEPVLYVNGRPHVLRLADDPLKNVEATGVTTDVVERMEQALQRDLRIEAQQHDGRVLLHDEVANDDGDYSIVPVWETATDEDILTPREVYDRMQNEGFQVHYTRVAITDEQAPVPGVFSQLEGRVHEAIDLGAICVFNCQMGRGRTTSGMIIAALLVSVREYGEKWLKRRSSLDALAFARTLDNERELREDELRADGEYRCILQLVGVLSYGRLAKLLLDKSIDRMEAIQNLRKAIAVMKLRADNAEPKSPKYRQLHHVYQNYLARYGYLLAFADYLLEKTYTQMGRRDDDDAEKSLGEPIGSPQNHRRSSSVTAASVGPHEFSSFPVWLKKRREITAILEREPLE